MGLTSREAELEEEQRTTATSKWKKTESGPRPGGGHGGRGPNGRFEVGYVSRRMRLEVAGLWPEPGPVSLGGAAAHASPVLLALHIG